jgi:hypothetical protein
MGMGRLKMKANWYSTPLWPGSRATGTGVASACGGLADDKFAARHERCYGRGHQILNLENYLDVLEKKSGAMKGSTPLQQWRATG